jgi:hypothetical protein
VSSTTSKRRKYYVAPQPENRTWDPGGNLDPDRRNKHIKINVSSYIYSLLATVLVSDVAVADNTISVDESSTMELDSHANMPVVGRHTYIISHTGRVAEVNPFTPDYDYIEVPIVDAAVQYECPYNGSPYILVIRNALYVPSMKNNRMPPFVMREAGVKVNDVPKIHADDPTVVDHSICFPETGFRIPMSLWGMFSYYFPTSKPTTEIMKETEDVYLLTPSRWNPHCDAFATNEENMLDWEGSMIEKKDRAQILLSEISEDTAMAASIQISSVESKTIDSVLTRSDATAEEMVHPCWKPIPQAANEVSSVLTSMSPLLDDQVLYERLLARSDLGKFQASIGSTNVMVEGEYLVDDDETEATQAMTDNDESEMSNEATLDELFESATQGEIDLDKIMVSATHTGRSKGVNTAHLSKVWRIDLEAAE